MKTTLIDLAGATFGRLTVLRRDDARPRPTRWWCRCACGAEVSVPAGGMRRGTSKSCGCLSREGVAQRNRKHGHKTGGAYTPEYIAWANILARCTNPNAQAWANYGGRGITICDAWRGNFVAFFEHVGARPSADHSIDRIDNARGYEPGNVRWATRSEQARNTRPRRRNEFGRFQ